MECACLIDEGKRPMKMIAYLLAIICVIAAVMYFVMPAEQLPTFMPGYLAGSSHIHTTHAIAAAVAAVVLFVIGWILGRR
jgi:membrane protein DedA with SNARE-associated domain